MHAPPIQRREKAERCHPACATGTWLTAAHPWRVHRGHPSPENVLIDYESSEDAIGFVMGHNLLRNYLEAAEGWLDGNKFMDSPERAQRKSEDYIEPARRHGKRCNAQICRTYSPELDFSIRSSYQNHPAPGRRGPGLERGRGCRVGRYRRRARLLRRCRTPVADLRQRRQLHRRPKLRSRRRHPLASSRNKAMRYSTGGNRARCARIRPPPYRGLRRCESTHETPVLRRGDSIPSADCLTAPHL